MKLNHPFVNSIPDVDEWLLESPTDTIHGIDAFCNRTMQLADKYSGVRDANEFKGDALELLVEYMMKTGAEDNRNGIYNYECVPKTEDFGCDGIGIGENGKPATVQVKFRPGDWVLTNKADYLTNFTSDSWGVRGVSFEDKMNMLLITTGLKVDERVMRDMLHDKVRVLNREALKQMYDNRTEWWKRFYEAVRDSRIEKNSLPLIPLREHQVEATESALTDPNQKGMIFLPTGTGKTFIEAEIACQKILEYRSRGILSPVIVVNSSRILLCFQLFDEFLMRIRGHKIQAAYVNFNSGDKDDAEYIAAVRQEGWEYRTIESTTSPAIVFDTYQKCRNSGVPLIIFSTYHSADRLAETNVPINVIINDEAHNLVSASFCKVATLQTECAFFFTATSKECGEEGKGMDNPAIFDNIIYQKSAKEMIDAGEMAPPYFHIVRASNMATLDRDYEKMFASIVEAYDKHEEKIKSLSSNPNLIGAKVLVVCRGQKDLMGMFKLQSLNDYRLAHPEIHFFGLSSEFGVYSDGVHEQAPVTNMKKHNLLKKLKALGHNEKAIIFHVDMIGEGIDVPGITGVMPFRNCEMTKLVQNIGRACRLHPNDRLAFYNGEVTPSDRTKGWIKPYSWIIIPSYMQDTEGMEWRIRDIVDRLKNEFGWVPTQTDVVEVKNGVDDPTQIPFVNTVDKTNRSHKSDIDLFIHDYEKLTPIERIMCDEEIAYKKKNYLSRFTKPVAPLAETLPEPEKTGDPACNGASVVLSSPSVSKAGPFETAVPTFVDTGTTTAKGEKVYHLVSGKRGRPQKFVVRDGRYVSLKHLKFEN